MVNIALTMIYENPIYYLTRVKMRVKICDQITENHNSKPRTK